MDEVPPSRPKLRRAPNTCAACAFWVQTDSAVIYQDWAEGECRRFWPLQKNHRGRAPITFSNFEACKDYEQST